MSQASGLGSSRCVCLCVSPLFCLCEWSNYLSPSGSFLLSLQYLILWEILTHSWYRVKVLIAQRHSVFSDMWVKLGLSSQKANSFYSLHAPVLTYIWLVQDARLALALLLCCHGIEELNFPNFNTYVIMCKARLRWCFSEFHCCLLFEKRQVRMNLSTEWQENL